jgi:hypothetical protein
VIKENWKKCIVLLMIAFLIAIPICEFTGVVSKNVITSTYYCTLFGRSSSYELILDENGIPITHYGCINGIYVGKQRSIVAVAEKSLDYWNKYQLGGKNDKVLLAYDFDKCLKENGSGPKNSTEARMMFLNCADWLVENAVYYENYTVWEYSYPSYYKTTPPWRSGQAQAIGIQALLRAYDLTDDPKYLNCARNSVQAFYIPVEDGGVTDMEPSGGWWYDKFADVDSERPKVLNGMMFALLGIYDFYERTNDPAAKLLFDKGIISSKNHLGEYDAGNWSYYDRKGNLASEKYHNIHIRQLSLLYNITGDPLFKEYSDKFKDYEDLN